MSLRDYIVRASDTTLFGSYPLTGYLRHRHTMPSGDTGIDASIPFLPSGQHLYVSAIKDE